jgi:hypothetical protein
MRRASSVFRFAALTALILVEPDLSTAKEAIRIYSNAEYKYRLAYPESWHISVVSVKAGPVLYNYDPSFAKGEGLLPPGGAEIFVEPAADLNSADRGRSPQELASESVRRFSHGSASVKEFANPGNPDISDVVRASNDYQRIEDEDLQRDVIFYFRFSGKPFALGLNYWKNDSKATSYEQTLMSVLNSIRHVAARSN